jgi:catalase
LLLTASRLLGAHQWQKQAGRKALRSSKILRNTLVAGPGGATHQTADAAQASLTTNQGVVVADNQNTLKSGVRGPSLLEDFAFREKITHFDHERIPERIVHARGSGAHGYFEVTNPIPHLTRASFLAEKGKKTEVFARFSPVAGGAGAGDLLFANYRGLALAPEPWGIQNWRSQGSLAL